MDNFKMEDFMVRTDMKRSDLALVHGLMGYWRSPVFAHYLAICDYVKLLETWQKMLFRRLILYPIGV